MTSFRIEFGTFGDSKLNSRLSNYQPKNYVMKPYGRVVLFSHHFYLSVIQGGGSKNSCWTVQIPFIETPFFSAFPHPCDSHRRFIKYHLCSLALLRFDDSFVRPELLPNLATGCSGKMLFFHNSLQPLPCLHRCKRLSKL